MINDKKKEQIRELLFERRDVLAGEVLSHDAFYEKAIALANKITEIIKSLYLSDDTEVVIVNKINELNEKIIKLGVPKAFDTQDIDNTFAKWKAEVKKLIKNRKTFDDIEEYSMARQMEQSLSLVGVGVEMEEIPLCLLHLLKCI